MQISIAKTEVMHVCPQGKTSVTTIEEAKKVCKFKCTNIGCNRVFRNAHGLKCHAGKCRWRGFYHIEKILAVRGQTGQREFLIKWEGYGQEHNRWIERKHITPHYVTEFLQANGIYDYNWDANARCPFCDRPCKSRHGVKIHMRKCQFRPQQAQNFKGTCADRKVIQDKLEAAQHEKPKVTCDGQQLQNVFAFKYLGSIFTADGSHTRDVKRRCALATSRFGALTHVFNSEAIPLKIKLKI